MEIHLLLQTRRASFATGFSIQKELFEMKYLQSGAFQNHPLMRLTLLLTAT